MIIAYYRYTPGGSNTHRPEWFSKKLCLESFLNACREFRKKYPGSLRIIFAIDNNRGLSTQEKSFLKKYRSNRFTDTKFLRTNGNTLSYREVFEMGIKNRNKDIILFAEDDYLWRPTSIVEMFTALQTIPCDYITPYDHPVRYDWNFKGGPDLPHWENRIFCTGSSHFRPQESTCMTFMSRAKTLKEDKYAHFLFSPEGKNCPNDRELFRFLQGLGPYKNEVKNRRLLVGPIPSLATHVHKQFLAPAINWKNELKLVKQWRRKLT